MRRGPIPSAACVREGRRVGKLRARGRSPRCLGFGGFAAGRDLEAHLGVRLLNRTTRRLSLTESGRAFYERCVQLLADLEEAEEGRGVGAVVPRGTLRLTCSGELRRRLPRARDRRRSPAASATALRRRAVRPRDRSRRRGHRRRDSDRRHRKPGADRPADRRGATDLLRRAPYLARGVAPRTPAEPRRASLPDLRVCVGRQPLALSATPRGACTRRARAAPCMRTTARCSARSQSPGWA